MVFQKKQKNAMTNAECTYWRERETTFVQDESICISFVESRTSRSKFVPYLATQIYNKSARIK